MGHPTGGPHALRPRPHQQRQQHVRVIPGPPNPTGAAVPMERGGIDLPDRRDHQPHRMVRRQPLPHIRWHQEPLIPIHRSITPGHQHILPKPPGQSTCAAPGSILQQPAMADYPQMIAPVNHIEPVPRRIRATLGARTVLDTTRALYLWESPNYPQYYIPLADVDPDVLVDEQRIQKLSRRRARRP